MPEPKPTGRVAILERMYTDIAERARSLISAPQVSTTEIRGVYNQYAAILEEARNTPDLYARVQRDFDELSTQLRVRVRADTLSHFQDLRILMGMLSYPAEASQLRGQHAQLETGSVKEFPEPRSVSVEARVAEYEGLVDPKVMIKIKPLQGKYVKVADICRIAGYHYTTFYARVKGKGVPKQDGKHLLNETTIPIIFGKKQGKLKPAKAHAGSIEAALQASPGEVLTFEQMLSYVVQHIGDDGQARVVELMEKHGDEIQVGTNRFLKAKLDELLVQ